MEMGRLDARAELADKLIEKVEKIRPELIRNGKAYRETKHYPYVISDKKPENLFPLICTQNPGHIFMN